MNLDAHPATTPEIRSLCEDLGVLGKVDFKLLLKWRLAVRKTAGLDGKLKAKLRGGVVAPGPGDEEDDEEDAEAGDEDGDDAKDEDDALLEEMESLKQSMDARARRDKKKKAKVKAKERQRTALGLHGQDEEGATGASEMDLFSLAKIRSKTGLDSVAKAEAPGVDAAVDSMSGMTSQPSLGAIVAALKDEEMRTGLSMEEITPLIEYWESVRFSYAAFESGQKSGSAEVYTHEMPGGQYTNLQFQSTSLGLADQWSAVKKAYASANVLLGDIVKVTPSSKVVGDLAQFMVTNGLDEAAVLGRDTRYAAHARLSRDEPKRLRPHRRH